MTKTYIQKNKYATYYFKDEACAIGHRENGPAIEFNNGTKEWYLNGKRHRVDGPAYDHQNGYKEWYVNNKLHRIDGPAIEYSNGDKSWYLNGKEYSEKEYEVLTKRKNLINFL